LGSLVKKGIVQVEANDSKYDIIYLYPKYWGLVNESWEEASKEAPFNGW
jgi:hypothetical protein